MLTPADIEWLNHLSDEETVTIVPWDPTAEEKFQAVKERIRAALGEDVPVEHHGASSLGISGQNEIDIYIPVPPAQFDSLLTALEELFGQPGSLYPLQRARFVVERTEKNIDVFLINQEHQDWIDSVEFENYLGRHADVLDAYRHLKEEGNGLSVREYYRRKKEFLRDVLSR